MMDMNAEDQNLYIAKAMSAQTTMANLIFSPLTAKDALKNALLSRKGLQRKLF